MWKRSEPPASTQVGPPRGEVPVCPCPHCASQWHYSFPVRIPLEAVRAEWEKTCGPYHKQRLAEYYGLYRDLFHGATFVPRVPLHVAYAVGEDDLMPVYYGNEVTPTEVIAGLCPSLSHVHRHVPLQGRGLLLFERFVEVVKEAQAWCLRGLFRVLLVHVSSFRFPGKRNHDNYKKEKKKQMKEKAASWHTPVTGPLSAGALLAPVH